MPGFRVNVDSLRSMAAGMERQAESMYDLSNHFYKINSGAFTGLLGHIRPHVDEVKFRNMNRAVVAQACCSQTGDSLVVAAKYYSETEGSAVEKTDFTLPGGTYVVPLPVGGGALPPPNAPYTDMSNARGRLVEPPSYDEQMSWKPALEADLLSISAGLREFVRWALGEDPFEIMFDGLMGDWREIRRSADIFNNAAWVYLDVLTNIDDYVRCGQEDWSGNAASAAYEYLGQLKNGLSGECDVNRHLSAQFKTLAEGAYDIFTFLSGEVTAWCDKLIQASLAAMAAGGTSAVPGLNILTAANAAYRLVDAAESGYEIVSATVRLKDMLSAFQGMFDMGSNKSFEASAAGRQFPDAPYRVAVGG